MPFLPLLSISFSSGFGSAVGLWLGRRRPPFFCRFPECPASSPAWRGGWPQGFSWWSPPFPRRSCIGGNGANENLPLPAAPSGTSQAGGLPGAWDLWPSRDCPRSIRPGRTALAPLSTRRWEEAAAVALADEEPTRVSSRGSFRSTVKDTI